MRLPTLLSFAILVSLLGAPTLAQAKVGAPYSLKSLLPYLDRGYTTRLGWEGWPITAEDPHLYRYDPQTLVRQAELEFGVQQGLIVSQTLKLIVPEAEVGPRLLAELNSFVREASQNSLSVIDLKPLLAHHCVGQWRLKQNWAVMYFRKSTELYLKVSRPTPGAKPINQCQQKEKK